MTQETLITELRSSLKKYLPAEALDKVEAAYQFAEKLHHGQLRRSGEPYIVHPIEVARILAGLRQDAHTIIAGLLHDTLEDTQITAEDLKAQFGQEVLLLVEGVTKLGKIYFGTSEEAQAENYRKMFLAMAEDLRVVVIKLADRLHNMRTLKHLAPEKQQRIAKETLDIFAPLAHRLGMGNIKWELEDLALYYIQPDAFQKIKRMVSSKRGEREAYIDSFKMTVKDLLKTAQIKAAVTGRPKHFYSIFRKLQGSGLSYDELYDLLGIRIITGSVKECYEILGVIHSAYKPVPGRIKDYIAVPKTNMYQSLHTTVIGPAGKPIEIQIRTDEMHQIAENGIAAHWRYKEGTSDGKFRGDYFAWLSQILDSQKEDDAVFLQNLRLDLFTDEVFVFSPKGEIQVLQQGATPIDYAYKIHTEIGFHCTGAKVNSQIVPLSHTLKNGDRVEILTNPSASPKLGWLEFVKTRQAKGKIRAWFRKQASAVNREKGWNELERDLVEAGFTEKEVMASEVMAEFLTKHSLRKMDDLFIQIGYGEIAPQTVVRYLQSKLSKPAEEKDRELLKHFRDEPRKKKNVQGIRVLGEDNIEVNLAKCCHPLPGDDVVGFVTLGFGVTVHRSECNNIAKLSEKDRARVVEVEWQMAQTGKSYPVTLEIEAYDRAGLLNDLVSCALELKTNILGAKSQSHKDGQVQIFLQLELLDVGHLGKVKAALSGVPDVFSVFRPRNAG